MPTTINKGPIGEQDLNRWDGTSATTFTRETSTGYDISLLRIGTVVDVLISYGGGVNYTRAAIAGALLAIGSVNKVGLVLRPGTWTIDDDLTITSNITLMPAPGCKFTVATGKTATIQGPVTAGAYRWIYGAGTTTISTYPQDRIWWGNTQRTDFGGIRPTGLVLGSDADGDMYYRAGGVLTRLAKGTAGQALKMNVGGTAPEWVASGGAGHDSMSISNISLSASVGSKALTVALKGEDGNDCSATNVATIVFRDETITTGTPNIRTVTGALSVTLSSGSTLGFTNAEAGRIYVWAIDNAGTVEMALSRTADIFREENLVSTTAEGGAGGADSATVMYSASARSNVACRCLGYVEITTGATAGEWDNAPTKVQIMGPGVNRTGDLVQVVVSTSVTPGSTNVVIPEDNTIPQKTEGFEVLTASITPTSAVNRLFIDAFIPIVDGDASRVIVAAIFKDDGGNALSTGALNQGGANQYKQLQVCHTMIAGSTASMTFKLRIGPNAGIAYWLQAAAGPYYGSTCIMHLRIMEVFS